MFGLSFAVPILLPPYLFHSLAHGFPLFLGDLSLGSCLTGGTALCGPSRRLALGAVKEVKVDDKGIRDLTKPTIMELIKRGRCICGQEIRDGNEAYQHLMMIHPITEASGTVCIFRFNDEVMLSFAGFGYRCILSDWYPMEDDFDRLLGKLDIANISVTRESDYFNDMIYSLARDYYLHNQPTTYELLPIDFILNAGIDGVDREEVDRQIEYELTAPQRFYGDDYVEYFKHLQCQRDRRIWIRCGSCRQK